MKQYFFRNNKYCFPDQGKVGYHTKKVTENELTYSFNTF